LLVPAPFSCEASADCEQRGCHILLLEDLLHGCDKIGLADIEQRAIAADPLEIMLQAIHQPRAVLPLEPEIIPVILGVHRRADVSRLPVPGRHVDMRVGAFAVDLDVEVRIGVVLPHGRQDLFGEQCPQIGVDPHLIEAGQVCRLVRAIIP
jgi:hypothetical protein